MKRIALLVVIGLALAAAASGVTYLLVRPDTPRDEPAVTSPAETETEPADEGPAAVDLGTEMDFEILKANVEEYRSSVPPAETADAGMRWDAVLVKMCNVDVEADLSSTMFTSAFWQLRDDDDGSYEPTSITYQQFPAPEYPYDRTLAVDACSKGWIVFPVPADATIKSAVWSPGGEDKLVWSIPEKE